MLIQRRRRIPSRKFFTHPFMDFGLQVPCYAGWELICRKPRLSQTVRPDSETTAHRGTYALMLNGCRQTWLILLPMQGREAGLSKATIGGLVAAGKFVDGLVGMTISGNSVVNLYRSMYWSGMQTSLSKS